MALHVPARCRCHEGGPSRTEPTRLYGIPRTTVVSALAGAGARGGGVGIVAADAAGPCPAEPDRLGRAGQDSSEWPSAKARHGELAAAAGRRGAGVAVFLPPFDSYGQVNSQDRAGGPALGGTGGAGGSDNASPGRCCTGGSTGNGRPRATVPAPRFRRKAWSLVDGLGASGSVGRSAYPARFGADVVAPAGG